MHLFLRILAISTLTGLTVAVWPKPAFHESGSDFLRLTPDFEIVSDLNRALPDDVGAPEFTPRLELTCMLMLTERSYARLWIGHYS